MDLNKSGVFKWLVYMSENNLMWIIDPVCLNYH